MKISVVFPAFNEEKYIRKTLESIQQLETKDWQIEVIVVNNGSTDKTVEIAKSFGVKVIHTSRKGIGFARQQGLLVAKGEIVVFTNADTLVPKDWLIKHVAALTQPGVVLSFGGYRYFDGSFPVYHCFNYIQPIIVYIAYKLLGIPAASGENMAFWRNKALAIGGFDENILVMEDSDLAVRMSRIGKVVYLPSVLIYSSGRRSQEGWAYFLRIIKYLINYFFLRSRKLERFPDFR
ncbi:glycosyltransferase [Candidatus Gottesmanbacteria bacterium]|nr:glycosyltransferase [Candidatus Gottesmanbacteria bacterium]